MQTHCQITTCCPCLQSCIYHSGHTNHTAYLAARAGLQLLADETMEINKEGQPAVLQEHLPGDVGELADSAAWAALAPLARGSVLDGTARFSKQLLGLDKTVLDPVQVQACRVTHLHVTSMGVTSLHAASMHCSLHMALCMCSIMLMQEGWG